MKYTTKDLQKDFPNDDICLDYIVARKYPDFKGYRVKNRKSYADMYGNQVYPLRGTIFENSSTKLTLWFYAMFLFSASKNGVSAKELQRQLGVTYKCAWRMANRIRKVMEQGGDMLDGIVEVDETYFGGRSPMKRKMANKSAVMGMVERKGKIRANKISSRQTHIVLNQILKNVSKEAHIMSDEFDAYKKLPRMGYKRSGIKHGKRNYVKGDIYTNTIEGFWGQLKRSIRGTYGHVSAKWLQSYVDEFAFRYNLRTSSVPIFETLLARVCR
jgi:transposase